MWFRLILISVLALLCPSTVAAVSDKVACYYETWSHWRPGNGKFEIANIDTNLCTHIFYAFVGINSNGTIRLNSDDLNWPGLLNEFKKLSDRIPRPELILTVGGWNEGTINFSKVAADANSRRNLLANVINLLQYYGFDGFSFHWEYPCAGNDRHNFVRLLEEFRAEFNKYGYILTAAVSANTACYDVPGISKSLDFILIMTCDLTGTWNSVVGHHSSYLDIANIINNWVKAGAPANKLLLLICAYGRSFTLSSANNNNIGAPIKSGGTPGPYTGESGVLGFNEICEKLTSGWTRRWISQLQVPSAYSGDQWVGYDDPESVAIKAKWVLDNNLGGICILPINTDDFRGTCGTRYPLLNAIKSGLKLQNSGRPPGTTPNVSIVPDKIVCYHGTWSHWRPGNGKFEIANIDTNLCTHIYYSFVGINPDGSIRLNSDDLDWPGFLNEYKKLRDRNPRPKLILAIGGWNEGTINFSRVAADANLRRNFLTNVIRLLQQYGFDGFDFDWEYPSAANDKPNFVRLLEEFRAEFNKYGFILTAAVSVNTAYYDVPGIAKSLDFINVMTYDFAGAWNSVVGHHSSFPDSTNSIINWRNAGAPANKLLLGVGTYGRSFTLSSASNNNIGAPIRTGGTVGPYTSESGILGYNEICEKLKSGWTRRWISNLQVPSAYSGDQWVGYDDPESIAIKAKWVIDNNLGGILIWSVETDDFRGICGTRYPLLNAIKTGLKLQIPSGGGGSGTTTTTPAPPATPAPTPAPTQPPTTTTTPSTGICKSEGYVRDPFDCSKFYQCQKNGITYIAHAFQCAAGLYFDVDNFACNWRDQVSCP